MWLFQGKIITEWKSSGSLLWIHGKRAFLSPLPGERLRLLTDFDHVSGLWEKCHLVCCSSTASYPNSFVASSSVIQDIMAVCETGSAIMAYFYFDFKDLNKQTCHDLLLSLVYQLSTRSSPCCDILHRVYEAHETGSRQPSDDILKECLIQMLNTAGSRPTFHCPGCSRRMSRLFWAPPSS